MTPFLTFALLADAVLGVFYVVIGYAGLLWGGGCLMQFRSVLGIGVGLSLAALGLFALFHGFAILVGAAEGG